MQTEKGLLETIPNDSIVGEGTNVHLYAYDSVRPHFSGTATEYEEEDLWDVVGDYEKGDRAPVEVSYTEETDGPYGSYSEVHEIEPIPANEVPEADEV